MSPVCLPCKRVMVKTKVGVSVAPNPEAPEHQYRGDIFTCSSCGHETVGAFGGQPHHEPNRKADITCNVGAFSEPLRVESDEDYDYYQDDQNFDASRERAMRGR